MQQIQQSLIKQFWSVADVAAFCGVKVRTVYSWITKKEVTGIPFHKAPGTRKLRFDPDQIQNWFTRGGVKK